MSLNLTLNGVRTRHAPSFPHANPLRAGSHGGMGGGVSGVLRGAGRLDVVGEGQEVLVRGGRFWTSSFERKGATVRSVGPPAPSQSAPPPFKNKTRSGRPQLRR